MRDIYLIDFENVASEGLSGITSLAPEDQVMIFYSSSSNRLSMKMHILIGQSVCSFDYFEVTVGGKNALDHQISTWLGYLIGTHAAERNYYIVSKDMGYRFIANFWTNSGQKINVRCIENIRAAGRLERNRQAKEQRDAESVESREPQEKSGTDSEAEKPGKEHLTEPADLPVCAAAVPAALSSLSEDADSPEENAEAECRNARNRQRYRKSRAKSGRAGVSSFSAEQRERDTQKAEPSAAAEPVSQSDVPSADVPSKVQTDADPKAAVHSGSGPGSEKTPQEPSSDTAKPTAQRPQKSNRQIIYSQNKPRYVDLHALLAPYPDLKESELQQLISENKRQVLCNTLRKQLGQEKGLALYNEIKRSAW